MTNYQELQSYIKEIEQSLIKINAIKRGRNFWRITFWVPMFVLLIIWWSLLGEIGVILKNFEWYWYHDILFTIILLCSCLLTAYILYIAYQIHFKFPKIFSFQFKALENLNKKLEEIDINTIDNFEEVLDISNQIYKIQTNMRNWKMWAHMFFVIPWMSKKLKNLWILESQFLNQSLTKTRELLHKEMKRQQKTLEQAKSKVEENIHGTTELEQVSKLQQVRLDKQIEQFNKLQRVLTKA